MQGNITGIDIGDEQITAVQVRGGLKGYQVLGWATVPVQDGGLGDALKSLSGSMKMRSDTYIATIPGDHISFRNVQLPFKDTKKIRQALPFEMESMLPFPVEDLLIDFIMTDGPSKGAALAASVKREFFSEYLGSLQANGIDPEVLDVRGSSLASWLLRQTGTPDHTLILEIGVKRNTLVLCLNRRTVLIRVFSANNPSIARFASGTSDITDLKNLPPETTESSFEAMCATIRNTVHAFVSQRDTLLLPEKLFFTGTGALYPGTEDLLHRFLDMPVEQIDVSADKKVTIDRRLTRDWSPALMNGALSLVLKSTRKEEGFNFRRDEFGPERRYLGLRKVVPKIVIFLFLILSFLATDMVIDYYSLKKEYRTLNREITAIFRRTLPEVTKVVDPVQQLRVKIGELKRSTASRPATAPDSNILDLLKEISVRIPKSVDVHINRMVIDPETVRITGKTVAFNEVDKIKNDLEPSTIFGEVTISSANLDRTGKKVQFEIKIDRK